MNRNDIIYPLFGIICDWKGLKEENYLYTAAELKHFEPTLYNACMRKPDCFQESKRCLFANKTWSGMLLRNETDLVSFLTGQYNTPSLDMSDEKYEELMKEWYWECVMENDLYGVESNTLRNVVRLLKIPEKDLKMMNLETETDREQ